MTEFVHVGSHADVLASGRSIGPGDRVTAKSLDLDGEDQHLVDGGTLVDVAEFDAPRKTSTAGSKGGS